MEGKEEISDTDSGIILHSSPDSPTTVMKDVLTHTRAMKLKHQSLEERLELCLVELKKLCIREAELTGRLSEDYPFLPGEKPPQIRRRIGAAFKLDKQNIPHGNGNSELNSVESELALQLQIHEASRRLCQEEHLSKAVKRSRVQQCKREERKVKELQETAFQLRLQVGRTSPRPGCINTQRAPDQGTSDVESLSDSVVLDEEEMTIQSSQPCLETPHQGTAESSLQTSGFSEPPVHTPYQSPSGPSLPPQQSPHQSSHPSLEDLRLSFSIDPEAPPIQHSPWSESSLDQPYQKSKKSRSGSSKSSSPVVTPVLPPVEACLGDLGLSVKVSNLRLCNSQSSSTPSTPEMHLRRQLSLRYPSTEPSLGIERSRDRTRGPRRRLTDYMVPTLEPPLPGMNYGNPMYQSGSEDSSSEHSAPSYAGSPCLEVPRPPTYQHLHSNPNNNQGARQYSGSGFYQNSKNQSSPSIHREYYEDGMVYPPDMLMGRGYYCQPAQSPSIRYEHWYEGAPVYPDQALRPLPHHVRLSRAPSLRESPHHLYRGLPRQVVNNELKSWHQRNQFREPRPRSLDRQGAIRVKNIPDLQSPLTQHHMFQEQVPQRQVLQRAPDGTPVQWFVGVDSEIVSQV